MVEEKKAETPVEKKEAPKETLKHFVRIANTDIEGVKNVGVGLRKIKGVGFMFASALCRIAGVDKDYKTGKLTEADVKKFNEILKEPSKFGIPNWLFNRQKDMATGEDVHLFTGDLQFTKENDIKLLRKIKCYKGVRHSLGLPVRGQNTRSNFRRNKTKGKTSLGVKRKPGAKSGK
jgi:small subunit ribosomal protein S13